MESTSLTAGYRQRLGLAGIGRVLDEKILSQLQGLRCGELRVSLPNGEERLFSGSEPGPRGDLTIRDRRFFRRVVTGADIGFAEAYLDGDWETSNLADLLTLAIQNEHALEDALPGFAWKRRVARLWHMARPNSHRGSKRNIAHHYDLGNSFYGAWLDPSMTYSAGLFAPNDDDLEAAQNRKFRRLADLAGIKPGDSVLEIGCGWGGFAIWAAQNLDCKVTAVTISRAQYDFAQARMATLGLERHVELRLQDYRDINGKFDAIVSIEMLEAVGERYWLQYFTKVHSCLKPGARAAIQVISIDESYYQSYRQRADFIQRYIFPGGFLPSMEALKPSLVASGLTLIENDGFGEDYDRTLEQWHLRFREAWPRIATQGFDQRFARMWGYYLAYCQAGFRSGRIDLKQLALKKT